MATERWNIDTAHSGIHFSVRHMVISKVRGAFNQWSGSIDIDPATKKVAGAEVSIDVTSIDTREDKRDGHLKSADFFDAENHPKITFKSKRVEHTGASTFKLFGDITIRGATKEIVVEGENAGSGKDPWGNERLIFTGRTSLERGDFGLKWNQALETGGVLVGERIDIEIDAQALKA
jgi:polyisoprenoid-binding protein YceI